MAEGKKVTVVFTENEPKKHTVRYNCKDADAPVYSIYISNKTVAALGSPKGVKITIEPA